VLAVLAVAGAASAALAAVALVSRESAQDQEALATTRELAASAIAVLDRDPELSVLLALQAAEAAEPTYEAVSALHEGLREHRTLRTLQLEPEEGPIALTPSFSASLSPDGRSVLVARLNRLEVWDVDGSAPRWDVDFEEGERVNARFSTDGAQVVGAVAWTGEGPAPQEARQGIIFWDTATGREVRYVSGGPCPAHAFSQNGPFVDPGRPVAGVAQASSTRPGKAQCDPRRSAIVHLDLRTGEKRELATAESGAVTAFGHWSTSADGRYVAIATLERAWVVDTDTGREVFSVPGDGNAATLSKDGSKVVTGGYTEPLTLWDVRSRERLGTFGQAGSSSVAVQFSQDEDTLVVIGSQGSGVLLYDIASGREQLAPRGHQAAVRGASLSRDGSRLASFAGDGTVRVWGLSPRGEVDGFELKPGFYGPDGVEFANGRAMAYVYPGGKPWGDLVVFDAATGKFQTEIPKIAGWEGALSPDGRRAAAQQVRVDASSESHPTFGPIRVHDLETGSTTTMQGMCQYVDREANPQCRKAPATPFREWVWSLNFSPDGTLLAAGGSVSGLSVWNATTRELLFNSGEPKIPEVPTHAFSPDGTLLAAVNDTEIVVYDVATWRETVRQPLEEAWLSKVVFTPDGRHLVGISDAEANVVVIDTETWEQSAVLTGHRGNLKDVDVSPDGRLIASSDSTGLVRIWDASTGEALQGIPFEQAVQNVEFVGKRHLLVTETDGPAAYVMTVDVGELLEIARSRVTRDLTDEECQTYLHVDACPSD
jgi:WD40 repeat protein